MPELAGNHDFLGDKPLGLTFNLLSVEHPEAWEGWLTYEIILLNGEDIVAACSNVTIIDHDVEELCRHLNEVATEEFEPMEPDFQVLARRLGEGENVELSIFLDEGRKRSNGYAGQGIGLRLLVSKADLNSFTEEIRTQYANLTKGLTRVE